MPQLPVAWSRETLTFRGVKYASLDHSPALIAPSPLPGAQGHYIVINSGHTFRGADLGKFNYLLFPRWGDWAILKVDPQRKREEPLGEVVLDAGYFDEDWKQPRSIK